MNESFGKVFLSCSFSLKLFYLMNLVLTFVNDVNKL